jgi:hypothetical protein
MRTSNSYWLTGWSAGLTSALQPISGRNLFHETCNIILTFTCYLLDGNMLFHTTIKSPYLATPNTSSASVHGPNQYHNIPWLTNTIPYSTPNCNSVRL